MSTEDPLLRTALGQRSLRRWLSYLAISAVIGIFISLVLGLSNQSMLTPMGVLIGAFVGVFVGLGAMFGEWLLFRLYRPAVGPAEKAWRVLSFALGGALGYFAAGQTLQQTFGVVVDEAGGAAALWASLFFGVFAAVVGLVMQAFEVMRSRLAESVAQLKEAEFAAKELHTARSIQQRLLPPERHTAEGYRLQASNRPAALVAGDFYDYFERGDGSLLFAVGDVAGKGLGASLIMAAVKARLPLVLADADLEHAVHQLNHQLCRDLGAREFVALSLLRLRPGTGELEWVTAGLPDPLLVRSERQGAGVEIVELGTSGVRTPLGISPTGGYCVSRCVLEPTDRILVYSDGLPESLDPAGVPRGYDWWFDQVRLVLAEPAEDLVERLVNRAGGAADGESPDDDCTVLLVERTVITGAPGIAGAPDR